MLGQASGSCDWLAIGCICCTTSFLPWTFGVDVAWPGLYCPRPPQSTCCTYHTSMQTNINIDVHGCSCVQNFSPFLTRVLPFFPGLQQQITSSLFVSRLHSCPVWAIGRSSLYLKVQRPDLLAPLCCRHGTSFDLFDPRVMNMIQHDSFIMQLYDHLWIEVICDDNANCAVLNLLCHM